MIDALPLSILNNRRMEKWLRFHPDRTVKLAVGKVEIGQGVLICQRTGDQNLSLPVKQCKFPEASQTPQQVHATGPIKPHATQVRTFAGSGGGWGPEARWPTIAPIVASAILISCPPPAAPPSGP